MSLPSIVLKSRADQRIKKGHLWIYSNEIDTKKTPLKEFEPGDLVTVISDKGKALGVATLNPKTLLSGRILTRDPKRSITENFLSKRVEQALRLRESFFPKPYYRLIYGDSDFLPGVIVDRFGEYLVLQITTAGMESLKPLVINALQKVLKPKGILVANDHGAREFEGLPLYSEVVGEIPEELSLEENNTRFLVPSTGGQKTGWFYDHRLNRKVLQEISAGKRVLDVFSYVGGWGMQAAQAGASEVSFVDASAKALDYVETNAELNGCSEKIVGYQGKAAEVLKVLVEEKQKFDIVVLDPPAFIKKKKDQASGETAYRQMNTLALRLVENGGVLVSGSCSMHLHSEKLTDIVRAAAGHVDRDCQMFYAGGQGPDHPVHPAIPETSYLKAQFYRVLQR